MHVQNKLPLLLTRVNLSFARLGNFPQNPAPAGDDYGTKMSWIFLFFCFLSVFFSAFPCCGKACNMMQVCFKGLKNKYVLNSDPLS